MSGIDGEVSYAQISAQQFHTVLLRSDGTAVACGQNFTGECNIPALDDGLLYTQVSAGACHTVLLRSDGNVVACGSKAHGRCNIPALPAGMAYTQVSAGWSHTVLLRSDGSAVAFGLDQHGQCRIPPLDEGVTYIDISAGGRQTVLLRSDGHVVACGLIGAGQEDIPSLTGAGEQDTPSPEHGLSYVGDLTAARNFVLQLQVVCQDDLATLMCSTLAGEEQLCLKVPLSDPAWDLHRLIASKLTANRQRLRLVLPHGQMLADFCRAHPAATAGDLFNPSKGTWS